MAHFSTLVLARTFDQILPETVNGSLKLKENTDNQNPNVLKCF